MLDVGCANGFSTVQFAAARQVAILGVGRIIERVCADLGEAYDEVSITDDPDLQERYGEEIPVTFVDGRQHDFWRVDEARLRAALGGGIPG